MVPLVLCLLGLIFVSPAAALAQAEAGSLRVLVVPNDREPEFFCVRTGCEPGFDREVLEGFAASRKLSLKPVPVKGWPELIAALNDGQGDVIAGRFTYTDARAQQIAFTSEVFPTRNVVVTYRPRRGAVLSVDELRRERVGTVAGTSMADAIAAAGVPAASVDASYTTETVVDALRSGKVSAVVLGIERAMLLNRRSPEFEIGTYVGPRRPPGPARLRRATTGGAPAGRPQRVPGRAPSVRPMEPARGQVFRSRRPGSAA
jgi:ABC-type amino acid transport substrate-binding protein